MMRTSTAARRRRIGTGAAVAAVSSIAALALPLAAPANADVLTLRAEPGISWGPVTPYGASCTYTLVAEVDVAMPVSFYDFDPASNFAPSNYITPVDGIATVRWTPANPGRHRIVAYQTSAGGPAINIEVGQGIDTGSACVVPS